MELMVRTFCKKGDTVFDCFMGCGTSGVAAVNFGAKFVGIEKDSIFFNAAVKRIQSTTEGSNSEYAMEAKRTNFFHQPAALLAYETEIDGYKAEFKKRILAFLSKHPEGITSKELAEESISDARDVTICLKHAEADGLVMSLEQKNGKPIWFEKSLAPAVIIEIDALPEPPHDGDGHGVTESLVTESV